MGINSGGFAPGNTGGGGGGTLTGITADLPLVVDNTDPDVPLLTLPYYYHQEQVDDSIHGVAGLLVYVNRTDSNPADYDPNAWFTYSDGVNTPIAGKLYYPDFGGGTFYDVYVNPFGFANGDVFIKGYDSLHTPDWADTLTAIAAAKVARGKYEGEFKYTDIHADSVFISPYTFNTFDPTAEINRSTQGPGGVLVLGEDSELDFAELQQNASLTLQAGASVLYASIAVGAVVVVNAGVTATNITVGVGQHITITADVSDFNYTELVGDVTGPISDNVFSGGGGSGIVEAIFSGPGIDVDATDPAFPIVSATLTSTTLFNVIQNYEDDGNVSGDGSGDTMDDLGYDATSAGIAFPRTVALWGSTPLDVTYDSYVLQEAAATLAYLMYASLTSGDNRHYVLNHQIIFPNYKAVAVTVNDSYAFDISFRFNTITDIRTTDGALFLKEPIDQGDAANYAIETKYIFRNFTLNGNTTAGVPMPDSYGLQVGASKAFDLSNATINGYDICFYGAFLLNSTFYKIQCANVITAGMKIAGGWWADASISDSVSQPTITRCRFRTDDEDSIGLILIGCDTGRVQDCQFEGSVGDAGVDYYNGEATTSKDMTFANLRFESESKYYCLIRHSGFDCFTCTIDTIFHQATVDGTILLDATCTGGANIYLIQNCRNSGGHTNWLLNSTWLGGGACCFDIKNSTFQGQPQTNLQFIDTGSFPDIWVPGCDVPNDKRIDFSAALPRI